jgi:hypothetical protein
MKQTKRGGLDPTSPTTKLNIWACTIGGGILGYAQFPGGSSATDGIVLIPTILDYLALRVILII